MATALSDYRTQTRQFLRDEGTSLYSATDVDAFINRALQQRDLDLGLNRSRIRYTLIVNQFEYLISTIVASGTVLSGPATPNVTDLLSVIVITTTGATTGGIRYPLGRWPYSRLAYLISVAWPTYPQWYAMYGTGSVFLAPPPAAAYPTEWDFVGYASPLVNPGDTDPLPYPWTDPVPFLAAHFGKIQTQRFDEAQEFLKIYQQRLALVRSRGRPMAVANPFADMPRGRR